LDLRDRFLRGFADDGGRVLESLPEGVENGLCIRANLADREDELFANVVVGVRDCGD
jgi:hypothetical protein